MGFRMHAYMMCRVLFLAPLPFHKNSGDTKRVPQLTYPEYTLFLGWWEEPTFIRRMVTMHLFSILYAFAHCGRPEAALAILLARIPPSVSSCDTHACDHSNDPMDSPPVCFPGRVLSIWREQILSIRDCHDADESEAFGVV